jgi:hypothetical protein
MGDLLRVGGLQGEDDASAWEEQVLSARGFKRVGRRSEHPI